MKTIFTCMLTCLITLAAYSQAGSLDITFSNNGKQTAIVGTESCRGRAVAIDHRGRIVVAGDCYRGDKMEFAVARFTPDGSLDKSFGDNGTVAIKAYSPGDGYYVFAQAVAIQPDDKIVVTGHDGLGSFGTSYVARINADGTIDHSFSGRDDYRYVSSAKGIQAVAVQADGKIVLAGWGQPEYMYDQFLIVRFNSNGIPDSTFGTDGKVYMRFNNAGEPTYDRAYAIVIQPDGKIVVGGESYGNSSSGTRFSVARLLSNGKSDKSFGIGGKMRTKMGARDDAYITGLALQSDGKILAAGTYQDNDRMQHWGVVRYLSDGRLDPGYGKEGKVFPEFDGLPRHYATSIAVQPNGKAVVGGFMAEDEYFKNAKFVLARMTPSGIVDENFGEDGFVMTRFDKSADQNCEAYGVAVQEDGDIIEAGTTSSNKHYSKMALARFIGTNNSSLATNDVLAGTKEATHLKAAVSSLKIYPNPVVNHATVSFTATGKYTLQVVDVTGKTISLQRGSAPAGVATALLNMSHVAAGRYVVVLTDEQQHRQTCEMVKE